MNNYKGMSSEEIKTQLEWSDSHEFSYGYSMWAFGEIERLHSIIKEAREYHDNCVNNLLDIEKIDEPQKLAYQVAYEIHKNYLEILDKVEEK